MRFAFLLAALVATVAAIPTPLKQHAADHELLKKQQDVIYLLEQITEPIPPNQQYYNLGATYDIENNVNDYLEPEIVEYFVELVKVGDIQPRGTSFAPSISRLRKETALVTRILLGAKNYDVFVKTAAYLRVTINEGQFLKAFISAVLLRADTQGVVPPALYEILPQYFFDTRIINQAQNIVLGVTNPVTEQTVVIPVNYTDGLPLGEHHVSYFTHDIGLALCHAHVVIAGYMPTETLHQRVNVEHPEQHHHIGRGHIYYYHHQQLLAHYNLERLSNGLQPVGDIDIEHPQIPYEPHLHSLNGLEFPRREAHINLTPKHHELLQTVHTLEKRLRDAIDSGHVITPQVAFLSLYQPQGLNILGELIESTGKSVNPRYYGNLQAAAAQLLGNAPEFNNIYDFTPSALETHPTSVRDPAFYQLFKRIIRLFHHYQESLPAHQYNDVVLPGVKIEEVNFPDLVTYFEHVRINLDNAIHHPETKTDEQIHVHAEVPRLNHKPYDYQVIVNAEQPVQNAVVRVYLGPKHDYDGKIVDINHHRHYFVELDQFVYNLQQGRNVIVRNSEHAPHMSYDYPSIESIKVYIDSAMRSQNPFYVHEPHQIFGYPARLSIPKGQHGGLPLQVLVVVHTTEPTHIPYHPVVPDDLQNYQTSSYQVVPVHQYSQAVQGHEVTGIHHTVEVVPDFHHGGIYGQDVEKLKHYYGHYLYKKYPNSYPFPHIEYYHGAGHVPVGQVPVGHQVHQTGSLHQGYQHHVTVPVGQTPYVHHQVYQGVHQGPGIHNQHTVYQGLQGIQGVQAVHGVHGVHNVHGVERPVGYQQHLPYGVEQETVHDVEGSYDVYKHNVDYLTKYYQDKHIAEVMGGAVSLDNKPLGWPLDRPLGQSALHVPNMKVADVLVYHEDIPHDHQ